MSGLTLELAARIVDAGLEQARTLNLRPMTIAVLDAGGHLVSFKREDRSGILRAEIAQGKAWGVLGLGHGGRQLAARSREAPAFYAAIAATSGGRVIPVPGGVLIRDGQGEIIGAVGVSGDMPDRDEACAVHGIERAGLVADTGEGHA
ncbi:MAG TPA: heme-binding protein [Caulobacteraceae bacterium]|jgi:uncharacterized protein GlcG (DUF336 family)|nr:heme-binding protein [Caulobacteraceae bacterium]